MKEFFKYLIWACIQQCFVLLPFWFFMPNDIHRILYAVLIFSFVGHAGNTRLALLTLLLAVIMYPLFFLWSFNIIYFTILIHAIVGTWLKINKEEMRVWRFI